MPRRLGQDRPDVPLAGALGRERAVPPQEPTVPSRARAQVRPLLQRAWERRGHLTIADGLYVVLAEELGATLVTADRNLERSPGLTVPTPTP